MLPGERNPRLQQEWQAAMDNLHIQKNRIISHYLQGPNDDFCIIVQIDDCSMYFNGYTQRVFVHGFRLLDFVRCIRLRDQVMQPLSIETPFWYRDNINNISDMEVEKFINSIHELSAMCQHEFSIVYHSLTAMIPFT